MAPNAPATEDSDSNQGGGTTGPARMAKGPPGGSKGLEIEASAAQAPGGGGSGPPSAGDARRRRRAAHKLVDRGLHRLCRHIGLL